MKSRPTSARSSRATARAAGSSAPCSRQRSGRISGWLAGKDATTDFQFNKRAIHHPFCATCGIQSYAYGKGRGGNDIVMINVRCLDDVDPESFEVVKFDGRSL